MRSIEPKALTSASPSIFANSTYFSLACEKLVPKVSKLELEFLRSLYACSRSLDAPMGSVAPLIASPSLLNKAKNSSSSVNSYSSSAGCSDGCSYSYSAGGSVLSPSSGATCSSSTGAAASSAVAGSSGGLTTPLVSY